MNRLLLAGLGGFLGSALRYALGGLLNRIRPGAAFPYETLVINVADCLAIGFLAALSESRGVFGGGTRVFLFIGVLGGFTTYSTFGYETMQLLRDRQIVAALASVLLQVTLGLGAVWAGFCAARAIWGR